MKKLKKIVTLLTLAAVCLTAPAFGKITVKAAEPNTYVLNFSPSKGEWRFKPASSWSEEVQDRELYYMMQEIKDGDYIVVQNDVDCNPLNLNVPVRLGNLTIKMTMSMFCTVLLQQLTVMYLMPMYTAVHALISIITLTLWKCTATAMNTTICMPISTLSVR